MEENDLTVGKFDEKLLRLMIEKVVVGTEGMLTFTLQSGMEIEV